MTTHKEEMMMHTHGNATTWGTPMSVGTGDGKGWYQQLRDWWTAHHTARRQATLDALHGCWDASREAVRPLRAEAAIDIALTQGALSIATQPFALAI